MKKNLTELVCILDRSGSMSGLESDTIGGFNGMLERQKKVDGQVLVSTVLFDSGAQVIHDRADIREVRPMTAEDYQVGGCTALLDAMGGAIHHISQVHKYAREEDRPEKTMVVIITDGQENASRRYTKEEVRRMVSHEQEKYGWEFLFLGANMDAIAEAAQYGIREDRAVRYQCDEAGTSLNFAAVSMAVETLRADAPLGREWKASVEEDYRKRGRKR